MPAKTAPVEVKDTKVAITLLGREYLVACAPGEDEPLKDIVTLVESKLKDVAARGGNATESRLFMLTCLVLADELLETKRAATNKAKADEDLMVAAVNHLRDRVNLIAQKVGKA